MASLVDLLVYLLKHYPHKAELSNARVTKMVYLCDWKHSIDYKKPATSVEWFYDNYGPFVWSIMDAAKNNPNLFIVESVENVHGTVKNLITLKPNDYVPNLSETEKKVANHVIEATKKMNWDEFINLIYSTYPIVTSERYNSLNLPKLAEEYKNSSLYKTHV